MLSVEPATMGEWFKRILSLRAAAVFFLLAGLLVTEMRYDWIEQAVGSYLTTTNDRRPKSGSIWEKGRQAQTARQTLDEIATHRLASRREAREAESFSQISDSLSREQGVMVSADKFRELFLQMPIGLGEEIISPFTLLWLSSRGRWERTYFEKGDSGLNAYLLSEDNRVLQTLVISSELLSRLRQETRAAGESLDRFPYFKDRVYSADRFFNVLNTFPEDVRRGVISNPQSLLKSPGRIVRVGISNEAVYGTILVGFEKAQGTQRRVYLSRGHEWAVWRLQARLEEKRAATGGDGLAGDGRGS